MTKDEKTLELVQRAVAQLKTLPPPAGITGTAATKVYYAIFDGPVSWKEGIAIPQEQQASAAKPSLRFKTRERSSALATTH